MSLKLEQSMGTWGFTATSDSLPGPVGPVHLTSSLEGKSPCRSLVWGQLWPLPRIIRVLTSIGCEGRRWSPTRANHLFMLFEFNASIGLSYRGAPRYLGDWPGSLPPPVLLYRARKSLCSGQGAIWGCPFPSCCEKINPWWKGIY